MALYIGRLSHETSFTVVIKVGKWSGDGNGWAWENITPGVL